MGRFREAEVDLRRALEVNRQTRKSIDPVTAGCLRRLVQALAGQGRLDEARPFAEELLEIRRTLAGSPDANAYQLNCYARELLTIEPVELRNPELALRVARQAFDLSNDPYHYNRYTLALAYEAVGDLQRAIEFARRALETGPVQYSIERSDYEAALARFLERATDTAGAEAVYRNTLALRRDQFPDGHADIAESPVRLGETLMRHRMFQEAESHLREAVGIRESVLDKGDWQIGEAMSLLGASFGGQGRIDEAEPLLIEGFTILAESPMAYSDQTKQALDRLDDFLRRVDRPEEVAAYHAMLPIPAHDPLPIVP